MLLVLSKTEELLSNEKNYCSERRFCYENKHWEDKQTDI